MDFLARIADRAAGRAPALSPRLSRFVAVGRGAGVALRSWPRFGGPPPLRELPGALRPHGIAIFSRFAGWPERSAAPAVFRSVAERVSAARTARRGPSAVQAPSTSGAERGSGQSSGRGDARDALQSKHADGSARPAPAASSVPAASSEPAARAHGPASMSAAVVARAASSAPSRAAAVTRHGSNRGVGAASPGETSTSGERGVLAAAGAGHPVRDQVEGGVDPRAEADGDGDGSVVAPRGEPGDARSGGERASALADSAARASAVPRASGRPAHGHAWSDSTRRVAARASREVASSRATEPASSPQTRAPSPRAEMVRGHADASASDASRELQRVDSAPAGTRAGATRDVAQADAVSGAAAPHIDTAAEHARDANSKESGRGDARDETHADAMGAAEMSRSDAMGAAEMSRSDAMGAAGMSRSARVLARDRLDTAHDAGHGDSSPGAVVGHSPRKDRMADQRPALSGADADRPARVERVGARGVAAAGADADRPARIERVANHGEVSPGAVVQRRAVPGLVAGMSAGERKSATDSVASPHLAAAGPRTHAEAVAGSVRQAYGDRVTRARDVSRDTTLGPADEMGANALVTPVRDDRTAVSTTDSGRGVRVASSADSGGLQADAGAVGRTAGDGSIALLPRGDGTAADRGGSPAASGDGSPARRILAGPNRATATGIARRLSQAAEVSRGAAEAGDTPSDSARMEGSRSAAGAVRPAREVEAGAVRPAREVEAGDASWDAARLAGSGATARMARTARDARAAGSGFRRGGARGSLEQPPNASRPPSSARLSSRGGSTAMVVSRDASRGTPPVSAAWHEPSFGGTTRDVGSGASDVPPAGTPHGPRSERTAPKVGSGASEVRLADAAARVENTLSRRAADPTSSALSRRAADPASSARPVTIAMRRTEQPGAPSGSVRFERPGAALGPGQSARLSTRSDSVRGEHPVYGMRTVAHDRRADTPAHDVRANATASHWRADEAANDRRMDAAAHVAPAASAPRVDTAATERRMDAIAAEPRAHAAAHGARMNAATNEPSVDTVASEPRVNAGAHGPRDGAVGAIRAAASRAAAQLRALFADEPDDEPVSAQRTASPAAPDSRIQPLTPRAPEFITPRADRGRAPADQFATRAGGPERAPADGDDPRPGARITIGHISVQALAPEPAPAPAQTSSPIVSLADYLRRREEMWG